MNRLMLLSAIALLGPPVVEWAVVLFAAAPAVAAAAEDKKQDERFASVYRLQSVRKDKSSLELSGFKVKGRPGLYTALHGVVGAESIRAFQRKPPKEAVAQPKPMPNQPKEKLTGQQRQELLGFDMEIAEVDLERDIAYLLPKGKDIVLSGGGLPVDLFAPDLTTFGEKKVRVYGYPMGVDELASSTALQVSVPPVSKLSERCPPPVKAELNGRASPAIGIQVLRLDGHLLPGHSGAAVLDSEGSVIAVGNGGLEGGKVGWGWGIPFHTIKLVPVDTARLKLDELAKLPVNYRLFCILNDDARDWFKQVRVVTTTVILSKDGDPVPASKLTPKEAIDKYMALMKGALGALGGKGDAPLEDAMKLFSENTVPLASGTTVEVTEVEKPGAAGAAGGPPGMPFPFPKIPAGGKIDDPLGDIGKMLGAAAEGVNVKVKVLDGPHKGKELWVYRQFLKRETAIVPEK